MKELYLFIVLLAISLVCTITVFLRNDQIKFEKTHWNYQSDIDYPYRDKMIKDLTTNHKLIGLKYSELINLLGMPRGTYDSDIWYEIYTSYGWLDPDHSRTLDFVISKDSIVTTYKVNDWKR